MSGDTRIGGVKNSHMRRGPRISNQPSPAAAAGGSKRPSIVSQVAALQTKGFTELKAMWRDLFGTDAPRYGLQFLRSRLAYRIQELALGGIRPETAARLDALADEAERELKSAGKRGRGTARDRPITGTRLMREWQGVEHLVTVRNDGYEYQGKPFKSLSAVARSITGTRWNGWAFFGLRNPAAGRRD